MHRVQQDAFDGDIVEANWKHGSLSQVGLFHEHPLMIQQSLGSPEASVHLSTALPESTLGGKAAHPARPNA